MKALVRWFRMRRACAKWNADIPLIWAMAEASHDGPFKWGQLVWQEIQMYIDLAKQVDPSEFDNLCKRRGFDAMMREYLAGMLRHVGIGRLLTANGSVVNVEHPVAEYPVDAVLGNDGLPWPRTFDGQAWAKEFIRHVKIAPEIATDEGTMIGWFANAVMVGYDRAKQEVKEPSPKESAP